MHRTFRKCVKCRKPCLVCMKTSKHVPVKVVGDVELSVDGNTITNGEAEKIIIKSNLI